MDGVDSSDFTFCKVTSETDCSNPESPKAIPTPKITSPEETDVNGPSCSGLMSETENGELQGPAEQNQSGKSYSSEGAAQTAASPSQPVSLPKRPVARAKVPFEKGFSQMDWMKLTRTHPDLAGLKGQSCRRLISMEEVKQHKNGSSIWTVLRNRVYNIAPYMKFHPGGEDMLMKAAGKDCTSLFNKYHAWVNSDFLLEKCLVGHFDPDK